MAGRKSKYDSHVKPYLDRITNWCRNGATEEKICEKLGVSVSAFSEYKNQFPALLEALKTGKGVADDMIEAALFNRAIGMEISETTAHVYVDNDKHKRQYQKTITKKLPPDTTAAIFWLKNRRPNKWRDRHELGVGDIHELMAEEQDL